MNDEEVLIFGGWLAPEEFMLFNCSRNILIPLEKKFFNYQFYSSKPINYEGLIYVISEERKRTYVINTNNFDVKELQIDF